MIGQSPLVYAALHSPIPPLKIWALGFAFCDYFCPETQKLWFQGFCSSTGTLTCPNQYTLPGGWAFGELFDHHDDQGRGLWVDTIIYQQL